MYKNCIDATGSYVTVRGIIGRRDLQGRKVKVIPL
jgi:hypothetical protein